MEQRISLITLGVADLARSRRFYTDMGWTALDTPDSGIVFFQLNGIVLSLYGLDDLAEDGNFGAPVAGFGGIVLAHNVADKAEVDRVLAAAQAAGGTLTQPARDTFWGGYAGCFTDPDGHGWEVATAKSFVFDKHGNFSFASDS